MVMHRKRAAGVCLLALLGGASGLAAAWPGYRGENGAGIGEQPGPSTPWSTSALTESWRTTPGESFSEFAISGDKALVFVMKGTAEAVVCADVATGQERWTAPIEERSNMDGNGAGPRATPAIAGGKAYVFSSFMKLVCLDVASGREVWRRDVKKDYAGRDIGWGPAASALVVDKRVVVVGGGPGKGILAFDGETGELAWGVTDEVHTHATPVVTTIAGQKQIVCFMVSGLVAVEPTKGDVLWRFPMKFSTSTAASPVVGGKAGDIVYCSAGYGVGAAACRVSKADGKWTATGLWRNNIQNHWASGVYRDGYIYCLDGFKNDKCPLICLNIETGATVWSQPGFGSQGGLIRVGGTLVVQAPSGDLIFVDASPDAYKELGRLPVLKGKKCWVAPSFAGGRVFTRSTTEGVCLKLPAAK